MLKYKDVENLPSNHPLYLQFWDEIKKEEDICRGEADTFNLTDEESYDYFNRYIAGDR